MSTITRRQTITGGAAIAAAAMLPSLPASASVDRELLNLWAEYQRLFRAASAAGERADYLSGSAPEWVKDTTQKLAHHGCTLLTKGLPEEDYATARERIAKLKTPEYLAAMSEETEAGELDEKLSDQWREIQQTIIDTPARSVEGVMAKLCLAKHWIEMDGGGEIEDYVALSALTDLEVMSGQAVS